MKKQSLANETIKASTASVWGASPAGTTFAAGAQPGTQEFFASVLARRTQYEMPWLAQVIPFGSFKNKALLEVGCGAGYDAYTIVSAGAHYTGIDITPLNPERTRRHLHFYGQNPKVLVGDAENLMFAGSTFDVAFSNGVLHHTPDIETSFAEIARVLKPGGDFWVILYHKNSIFYWLSLWLVSHILRLGFRKRSFKERLAMIEYTTSGALPLVNAYSKRSLTTHLESAGFTVAGLWIRKLTREDLPGLPLVRYLYPLIPQQWLDHLGERWGWYLIAHASKRSHE